MSLSGGKVTIKNTTGQNVYFKKSAKNSDPWVFVDDGGKAGMMSHNFCVYAGQSLTLSCGAVSVDGHDGPNFFARIGNNEDAPFTACHIYCSGDDEEHDGYHREGRWPNADKFGGNFLVIFIIRNSPFHRTISNRHSHQRCDERNELKFRTKRNEGISINSNERRTVKTKI